MRQHDIIFLAAFGEEFRIVKITSPNGAGSNTYHLLLDNIYYGVIVKRGKWEVILQVYTDAYTSADFDVLTGMMISKTS